jgi:LuxR family maltose regulon positive regulatory protein
LLKALALAGQDVTQAKQELIEVLAQARVEGYQRLFFDEGEPVAALLRAALLDIRDAATSAYVQALLHTFGAGSPQAGVGAGAVGTRASDGVGVLVEPLSAQEQRVLRLLARGMSNPDIARELVVSVNTVKTQLQSIYRKLNVNSRAEAGEAARRLGLL